MFKQPSILSIRANIDQQVQFFLHRIISNNSIIAGAFEDSMIRIFDRSKVVHSFEAHN